MPHSIDWTKAASLSPDELARALDEDHDEVDDNPELTDEQLAELRPASEVLPAATVARLRRARGRPKAEATKQAIKLRLDRHVVEAFKATGPGWQTRMNDALAAAAERLPQAV